VIAAVTPQIMQCKLASYYPAASSVEAATTQSRHCVSGKFFWKICRENQKQLIPKNMKRKIMSKTVQSSNLMPCKNIVCIVLITFFLFFNVTIKAQEKQEPPMRFVTTMPEPICGIDSVFKFIEENLQYPDEEIPKKKNSKKSSKSKYSIHGQVFVEFVVEKDGSISNVRVLVGISPEYDAEAVRVIQMLPNWKPGRQNGKLVRTYFQIPVRFLIH
jgi:TonB family protein